MFVFCCYSTSVFWLFRQLVHNLKTHLKFKHAVCTSYHNICDLLIIKNKWTKTKKLLGFLYRKWFYIKDVFIQLKNTKPNKTKKFNSWKHFSTNKAEKRYKKKQQKKQKAHFWTFSVGEPKCLGTKCLRWGLEGFRCGPVSMIKLV